MVPRAGLEPAQTYVRRILSPLRLPISPPRHKKEMSFGGGTRIRTGDQGFADPRLTTWLCRHTPYDSTYSVLQQDLF
jgi:hypothetical protein